MAVVSLLIVFFSCNVEAIRAPSKTASPLLGQRRLPQAVQLMNKVNSSAEMKLSDAPTCQCQHSDATWAAPTRTNPKCIFIDLGAADGNTFNGFLANQYGPVQNCGGGTGDYEAILVEANPRFAPQLQSIQASNPKVHAMASTAAYMCEGQTSFFLDVQNHDVNYWGSSMSANHPDTIKSGHQKVTVPTANLIKLIAEYTIPDDYVIVKMDIEGAEWEILPCLAEDSVIQRIDRLLLEQHPQEWSVSQPGNAVMENAKSKLKAGGVDMPNYFTNTL